MASNKFKTLCKEEAYKNRLGKVITPNETITNTDNLSSIEITDSCISNNKIVGTAIAKTIKFTTTEDYELVDKEIDAQIGVLYDDTTTEYINVGKYTINKENANNTSKKGEYNGLDLLKKLDTTYVCGITDLSKATIGDFWKDACNQVGLTPNETTFTNSNIVIGGNPFNNNETVKTVMQQVAEAGMYWVEIDNDTNKVKLNWFTNTIEETFTKDDYSYLEKNNTYGPINSLVVGLKDVEGENVARQDSASVTKVGENQFAIYDNYFLYNEELRNQAIDNLWNKIKGFTYVNYSLTTYTGKPYLKRGSKISIEENDGTTFETYVLNHTFTYDGAFKSVISANSITNGETTNKNLPESASLKFKKVELKVDKVEGEIAAVVEQVKDIEVETTLTKEANGNPVVVTDAGPYPLESIKITGKSYQETKTSRNKFYIDKSKLYTSTYNITLEKDGGISFNGTLGRDWFSLFTGYIVHTLPAGTYTFSITEPSDMEVVFRYRTQTSMGQSSTGNIDLAIPIGETSITFTVTEEILEYYALLQGGTKGNEINDIVYIQLEEGDKQTEFVPNGGIPSPEFPSEIKNVEGVTNHLPYPYLDTTKTINGITFTDNGDGSITVNGTATATASFKLYGVSNKQVPLENKYITCGVANNSLSIRVVNNTNNTYNVVTSTNINNLFAKVDNTTYKEGYYELVVYSGHTINNLIVEPMVIDDINDISYVPYGTWLEIKNINEDGTKENTARIDLNIYDEEGNIIGYRELSAIGDTKDTFENGVLTQRIGKAFLDGSEYYSLVGSTSDYYEFQTSLTPNAISGYTFPISTHFSNQTNNRVVANGKNILIRVPTSANITTPDEFKTWLSENNVTIEYILATPIEHTLNYEVLELHEGYNNITTNDGLEPNMEITYLTDSKLNAKYATKGELKIESDSIKQSVSGEISALDQKTEASLELKVDTVDYNDKKIISMINASADEINLKANRFSLESTNATITKEGVVDFVKGTIGNIDIGDNYLKIPITVKVEITQELIDEVLDKYNNGDTFTAEEIEMYDLNKDGKVTNSDIAFMRNAMQYNITPNNPGYLEILSDEFKSHIAVIDGNGKEQTKVSLTGITSNSISGDRISADELMVSGQDILSRLEKNYVCLKLSENHTIATTNTLEYLKFTRTLYKGGNRLSVTSDGKVKVGAGVSMVKISVNATWIPATVGLKYLYIYKGATNWLYMDHYCPATQRTRVECANFYMAVAEGDIISIPCYGTAKDAIDANRTFLTVEVVE